jgi:hypothetical protein
MAIEIVDFPIENGGSFHSSVIVNVYQRVYWNIWCFYMLRRVSQLWSNIVTNCGCGLYCNLPYEPQTLHHIILSQSSHMVCLKPRVPQNHPLSPQAKQGLYWLFFIGTPIWRTPHVNRESPGQFTAMFSLRKMRVLHVSSNIEAPALRDVQAQPFQSNHQSGDLMWYDQQTEWIQTHIFNTYMISCICVYIYT